MTSKLRAQLEYVAGFWARMGSAVQDFVARSAELWS